MLNFKIWPILEGMQFHLIEKSDNAIYICRKILSDDKKEIVIGI